MQNNYVTNKEELMCHELFHTDFTDWLPPVRLRGLMWHTFVLQETVVYVTSQLPCV